MSTPRACCAGPSGRGGKSNPGPRPAPTPPRSARRSWRATSATSPTSTAEPFCEEPGAAFSVHDASARKKPLPGGDRDLVGAVGAVAESVPDRLLGLGATREVG